MTAVLTRVVPTFTANVAAFRSAVSWVAKRVSSRPVVPHLGGILIRLADDVLTLSAFDDEVAVTGTLRVDGSHDGVALISGRLLAALTETLPNKPVQVSADGERLKLDCGSVHLSFPTMQADEYPNLPEIPARVGTVGAEAFARSVKRTAVATHSGATPAIFTALYMRWADQVTLMASDTYRAAVDVLNWQRCGTTDDEVVIQAHLMAEVASALSAGGDIDVHVGNGMFALVGPDRTVVARQMTERYTGAQLIRQFPAVSPTAVRVNAAEMIDHLRRADLVHAKTTPILLVLGMNELSMRATGADTSAADAEMPCAYEGEPLTIQVNPTYVLDAIKAAGSAEVDISFVSDRKPFLVTPAVEDPYRQLVMPIRLPKGPTAPHATDAPPASMQ